MLRPQKRSSPPSPLSDVEARKGETPLFRPKVMKKLAMPLATITSGSRKVSKKQFGDFISSEGKRNSKNKQEKHKSMSHWRQEKYAKVKSSFAFGQ